jgi:hypothetical protein
MPQPNWWENHPLANDAPRPIIANPRQPAQVQGDILGNAHVSAETNQINQTLPSTVSKAATDAAAARVKFRSDLQDQQQKAMAQYQAQVLAKLQGDAMLKTIDKAQADVGPWSTGLTGMIAGKIPGFAGRTTDARELKQYLDTIKGNVAFKGYEDLKAGLPQGAQGGIRLTGPELDLLQKLQGNLDQSGDVKVIKESLANIRAQYQASALKAAGIDPNDPNIRKRMNASAPPQQNANVIDFNHWGK